MSTQSSSIIASTIQEDLFPALLDSGRLNQKTHNRKVPAAERTAGIGSSQSKKSSSRSLNQDASQPKTPHQRNIVLSSSAENLFAEFSVRIGSALDRPCTLSELYEGCLLSPLLVDQWLPLAIQRGVVTYDQEHSTYVRCQLHSP